ncbi:porin [Microvirga solisilvae]|uniref:porin n=1 Tax=Microvirga solisilvae TaxID=2919498 RepID=UPI001FAF15AB|nr:porin [Microvirga solisilvae]
MKLVKSLLLGSVAGLAAVAGAQAADLPAKKAAAVEYVRVCSTYGAGFFYIPGTETCLRVGGRARAEIRYVEPDTRARDSIGFRARGRIQLDARTATAYGLLRTFVRFEMTRDTGVYGASATTANVDQAFVQFGGLTAGRALSFFDNGDLPTGHMGTLRFSDAPNVNLFAYTFSFGNGFSASLSVEEGRFAGNTFDLTPGAPADFFYGGQRTPDLVAQLKYSGTWGSAMLAGAAHQIRSVAIPVAGFAEPVVPDTEYGFAVTAQVGINLPMLAAGDALWIAATYADGAMGYLGFGGANGRLGSVNRPVVDAYYDVDGEIDTAQGWSIAGGLRHYWTPEIRQNVFGSYARVEYGAAADALFGTPLAPVSADFNEWRVGTNVFWQPVAGLDLGVEVLYANIDPRGPDTRSGDAWEGRIRVQRDF